MSTAGSTDTGGLGRRAARGAAVTFAGQGGRIALQVLSVIVLARLLTPHDYGLVAMVLAVIGVAEIFRDFGLSAAAVQSPTLTRGERDNLFWINSGLGLVLAIATFLAAPLVAAIYRQPELTDLTRLLALIFLINGLAAQYRADRNRHLKFTVLAAADLSGAAVGLGVAITTALLGWGYWALAAQQICQGLTVLVVLISSARWVARLPDRRSDVRRFMRFGWHLVGTQVLGYATNNVDSIVIGIRFGAAPLGIYSRGFQLLMQPLGQLRAPTTTVALPVLSRLSDDPARFDAFLIRGQQALGYVLVSGLAIVAATAHPLVDLTLGPGWEGVAPILQILAAAAAFQTLAYVGYWVYLARALTADLFKYTLVTSIIKIICIIAGSQWGVIGVAVGYAIGPAIAWPISILWLATRTSLPARALVIGAMRILLAAGAAGVAAWGLTRAVASAPDIIQVVVGAGGYAAVLAIIALCLPAVRRDCLAVIRIVRLLPRARSIT